MTLLQIKEKLQTLIEATEDEDVLQQVYFFLEMKNTSTPYVMNKEEINAVEEALEQVRNGQFLTHDEAMKRLNEWKGKSYSQKES